MEPTASKQEEPKKHKNSSGALSKLFSSGNEGHTPKVSVASSVPVANQTTSPVTSPVGSPSTQPAKPKISFNERVKIFEQAINADILDLNRIHELAFQGIPESPGLRGLYWKVLLKYLPKQRTQWDEVLKRSRDLYQGFVQDLFIDPTKFVPVGDGNLRDVTTEDHPLNTAANSQWKAYFKDHDVMEEIDKDVKRTFPHLHFFNGGTGAAGDSGHYQSIRRILFLYAKLNPGISYVQGMNEVLGPIYYLYAHDKDENIRKHAEADAFFCFTNLMSEIMNNFCKTLDRSDLGIVGTMQKLNNTLKAVDHELWKHLEDQKMNPQFYSFRWLTLLLSQEFDLPDVLRLWDSLFADKNRFDFLLWFCTAMLVNVKDQLLHRDFADNLKLLQCYPPTDIHILIDRARELRDNYLAHNPHYQPSPFTEP